jgi:nucleotide-binding universal stress UspA family protein
VVDEGAAAGKIASADLVRMAREEVDSWRARLASASAGADVTIAANPGDGILGYAGHREHDLILLPATARSEVAAVLLGSTVRRVVRGTSVPVLVLPATNRVPPEPFFARAAGERVAAPA